MFARGRSVATVSALAGLAALLAGCPLEWENEGGDNSPPFTFFDVMPNDTTFTNEAFFTWLGTDLDSDVVAYQYQLVETDSEYFFSDGQRGRVLRSIDPRREYGAGGETAELWSEQVLDNSQSFSDLPDGWYEMRARAIDDAGTPSTAPARRRFYVFFDDIPPTPIIVTPRPGTQTPACGRINVNAWTFFLTAVDSSRSAVTPREQLQYSYQLRGLSVETCSTHLTDPFTEWTNFPAGADPVEVGALPPTVYSDLFDPTCGWELTLRVRDPAGNLATAPCCVSKASTGCR
jgi:hypothetical protein